MDFDIPDFLFDFQKAIVSMALRKGRSATFADCGLGKTPMQLVWADQMYRATGKPTLILAPLAVSQQTATEAEKFGIECQRSRDGAVAGSITITNYERLHLFNSDDYGAVVCDESSILKAFNGTRKKEITEFMRKIPYRLLATATAAPNDYTELGTSSEALGYLGFMDMLNRFFKNDQNNSSLKRMYGEAPKWRFRGHAEQKFWQWVTSWAVACRRPSDIGYGDGKFVLPEKREIEHIISAKNTREGLLFDMPATTLPEQREERKRTIVERCEKVAGLVCNTGGPALVWCHLNEEGELLSEMIGDSVEVAGRHSDEQKEERFLGFAKGDIRVLVTKPKIGAWGLNFQHCNHVVFFPSHSYEQYYQSVRRCWRFGQKRPVTVDIVLTEGDRLVMRNMMQKGAAAERMFANLVAEMNNSMSIKKENKHTNKMEVPSWL
jgi:hypothetical protein